jgi:hypothetical protein
LIGFGKKRRDEERVDRLIKVAVVTGRLKQVGQVIATISPDPLNGKDATEQAGEASAALTRAIVKATIYTLTMMMIFSLQAFSPW